MKEKLLVNRIIEDMARHPPRDYQKHLEEGNIFGDGGLFDAAAGELRRTKRHYGSHHKNYVFYFLCCLYFWAMKEAEKRVRRENTFLWRVTLFRATRGAVWYALRLWWFGHRHSPLSHEFEIQIRIFTKADCHRFAHYVENDGFNHHLTNNVRYFIDALMLRNRHVSEQFKREDYLRLYGLYKAGHIWGDTARRVRKEARFYRLKNPSLREVLPPFPRFIERYQPSKEE